MPAWTEEASFPQPASDPAALRPAAPETLSISGVPWVTIGLLLGAVWVLVAAGGLRSGVALPSLLVYGAKATPLILDRGETWRLFAANLLHKDPLHLAFNAFALWNVGGALERAVRPADYTALLILTALGTTLVSAIGADSISLGASGMAFGMLGASATFGWRRGACGTLRSYFGLRIVPWLLALFAAGLGSAGVDNWGHAGGLLTGALVGCFLTPRRWPGDTAARRLAAAAGALLGTLSLGVFAAPALPALGQYRDGPAGLQVKMPLGWERIGCFCKISVCKRYHLERFASQFEVPIENTLAIGDTKSDICMIKRAGLGVAFMPKDKEIAKASQKIVQDSDLLKILEFAD